MIRDKDEIRRLDVFQFVLNFLHEHNFSPSLREIAKACYMSHTNVAGHLGQLEGRGWITREYGIPRSIGIGPNAPDAATLAKLRAKLQEVEIEP